MTSLPVDDLSLRNLMPLEELRQKASGPVVALDLSFAGIEPIFAGLARTFPDDRTVNFWQFGNPAAAPQTPLNYWPVAAVKQAMDAIAAPQQAEMRLLAGHFSYRIREVLPPSRLFVSVVRNPVDRILASYASHAASMKMPLSEAIESQRTGWKASPFVNDYQVRSLSGDPVLDPDVAGSRLVPVADLADTIREISENFILLGVAERIEETIVLLARQLGIPLSSFAGFEKAPKREDLRAEVSAAVLAELEQLNRRDQELLAFANRQLDKRIAEDAAGFTADLALLRRLSGAFSEGKTLEELCRMEIEARGRPQARLRYDEPQLSIKSAEDRNRADYLDLMEEVLVNRIYSDVSMAPWTGQRFDAVERSVGSDWPAVAHTMIGKQRIHNVRELCEIVLKENVPGDLIETGVWRGGATIMMRAVLRSYGDLTRTVFVADSFSGVPEPDEKYPADTGDVHFQARELAISQAEVASNFRRYRLLDRQVRFLPGLFKDTLPVAPIERLALMRLDGDLYESTMDALNSLYLRLSPGGFVIIDDYGAVPGCKAAVDEFRGKHGIREPLQPIDWAGVYWRKLVVSDRKR